LRELPSSSAIGAARARELLTEVGDLRQRTRRPTGLWPPLVIFGVVAAAGAPLAILGSVAANLWWLVAAPVAFALIGRLSSRLARQHGIEVRSRRLMILGIASFAAGWLACLWLAAALRLPAGLGWTVAVAVGYLVWARLARSVPVAVVAVSLAVVGIALVASPVPAWTVQFGVGVTMVIGGLVLRSGPEAS
jgi:hypothetical protein